MAAWWQQLRDVVVETVARRASEGEQTVAAERPPRRPEHDQTPVAPEPTQAVSQPITLRTIPLLMAVVGGTLTGCSELIRGWAVLGYLLLTAAPMVYWLQRIEYRLAEQNRLLAERRR